jgi:hypothetical protein
MGVGKNFGGIRKRSFIFSVFIKVGMGYCIIKLSILGMIKLGRKWWMGRV